MRGRILRVLAAFCAVSFLVMRVGTAVAQPLPPMSSIIIDARTGKILYQQNANQPRYPASLTKLMTLYMLFEALRDHRITLGQMMPVSVHAASVEPVKLGVRPGSRLSVEEAILGMVTLSANDAATVAGEFLAGGDETRFGALMTLKAHALGMNNTVFRNASGLPDAAQITTAHDVALLARRLIQDFPEDYHYFSTPSFVFRGHPIYNHDHLLKSYPGADGMKTGYTNAAGHNLVTSAVRGGVRLIGVVMAAPSNAFRDRQMTAMLNAGFETELGPNAMVAAAAAARDSRALANAGPAVPAATQPADGRRVSPDVALASGRDSPAWSLDLGNYTSKSAAYFALHIGVRTAHGGVSHLAPIRVHARTRWHAWITEVSPVHARPTCLAMNHYGRTCVAVHPYNSRQVAER
ncbi:MAG: D-alanyl-D-alanine carboxypeptidase [Proteobacteria bacterium]|nr:D-alanyl-D-alanine carboxypeptidase [Pseudomonadota bacterium]